MLRSLDPRANTSVKSGRTLLAVPKKIRGAKDEGDVVGVWLEYDVEYRS